MTILSRNIYQSRSNRTLNETKRMRMNPNKEIKHENNEEIS